MPGTLKNELPDPRENALLAALPKSSLARLCQNLQYVEMPLGWTMSESGQHVSFLHFPVFGIVSLIYALQDGSSSEVALVGNEGLIGISIFMGGASMPGITEVQCSGGAYRLSRKIMKQEFALGGKLQNLALLYTQALISQTSQVAVCNQHHSLEQRLCRWILMCLDRLRATEILITQEVIANLLGVRRESITETIGQLQRVGAVEKLRGRLIVLSRNQIEQRVCECYSAVCREYARLLPVPGQAEI